MDGEQLKELVELDKKGLALPIVEGGRQKFVVHKNIRNKIPPDLIGEDKEFSEFVDRSGSEPAVRLSAPGSNRSSSGEPP